MITLQFAKSWLRSYSRRRRKSTPYSRRAMESKSLMSRLIKSPYYRRSRVVATYLSFGSEVDTGAFVKQAWRDKKIVLIPMVTKGLHRPYFCEYREGDPLRKTKLGPMELAHPRRPYSFSAIDLILVPGLAFDERGHRLGYGGGVYDRLLLRSVRAKHVGVFFEGQLLYRLPSQKHDRRVVAKLGY